MSKVAVCAQPFCWPIRVYYEDTDASGVVYHAVYLEFMERARTEWLRTLGADQRILKTQMDVAFTVSRLEVAYLRPARLDDQLDVTVAVVKLGRAGFVLEQYVSRAGQILCRATVRIACVSAKAFRPRAIPETLKLEELRGN